MLAHTIRRAWYAITAPLARAHVRDALTDAVHPEFGWHWQGQDMLDALAAARHDALRQAADVAAREGPLAAARLKALAVDAREATPAQA